MKKITVAVISILLCGSLLTACGKDLLKEMAGDYKVVSVIDENGTDMLNSGNDLAEIIGGGLVQLMFGLKVREDGKATITAMGTAKDVEIDVKNMVFKSFNDNGEDAPFTYKDGRITITNDGATLIFDRDDSGTSK